MNVAEKRGVTEIDNEKPKCKACGSTNIVFVEYGYGCPERHDGWSEIDCKECGKRFGRWSGKELKEAMIKKSSKWKPYRTYACMYLWAFKDA